MLTKGDIMKEHDLIRIQLLKILLELEEKLTEDLQPDTQNFESKTDGNRTESSHLQQENVSEKAFFSVLELSDYLGVSTDSIYTMVRENQIPHVRVRRRILFHKHAIDLWIQGNTINTR
jgi:excisionase family DNA binding protein